MSARRHDTQDDTQTTKFTTFAINQWNKLDSEIRNGEAYASFQKVYRKFQKFTRPAGNSTCKNYDLLGIKPLSRLQLSFSHLLEQRFRHKIASLNLLCSCFFKSETTLHFFLCCQNCTVLCRTLMTEIKNINSSIMSLSENDLLYVIIYSKKNFDNTT